MAPVGRAGCDRWGACPMARPHALFPTPEVGGHLSCAEIGPHGSSLGDDEAARIPPLRPWFLGDVAPLLVDLGRPGNGPPHRQQLNHHQRDIGYGCRIDAAIEVFATRKLNYRNVPR